MFHAVVDPRFQIRGSEVPFETIFTDFLNRTYTLHWPLLGRDICLCSTVNRANTQWMWKKLG